MENNRYLFAAALILGALAHSSCTSEDAFRSARTARSIAAQDNDEAGIAADEGVVQTYTATLNPLNDTPSATPSPTPSGSETPTPTPTPVLEMLSATGVASVVTDETNLNASVQVQGLEPDTEQMQFITASSQCPTSSDDANGDGYIDAVEAVAVAGKSLLPLDETLEQQVSDSTMTFPSSDVSGSYTYTANALIDQMLASMRADNPERPASMAQLGPNDELDIDTRAILIHGVPASTQLPASVQSVDGLPAYRTLPVACGQFVISDRSDDGGGDPGGDPGQKDPGQKDPGQDNKDGETTPTPTPTPSSTPEPTPSATPESKPTATPKSTPSPTPSPSPTASPTPTPTPTVMSEDEERE